METSSPKTGKIAAIIFIAILVLPVCYALIKELLINRAKQPEIETPQSRTDSVK